MIVDDRLRGKTGNSFSEEEANFAPSCGAGYAWDTALAPPNDGVRTALIAVHLADRESCKLLPGAAPGDIGSRVQQR